MCVERVDILTLTCAERDEGLKTIMEYDFRC